MATIKLTIYNDLGEGIGVREKRLEVGVSALDDIESAVELFFKPMLSEVTKILLEESQATFKEKFTGAS